MEDPKTKMTKDTPYELLKDDEKKQLGKSNEAKMTLYNALPHSENFRKFFRKGNQFGRGNQFGNMDNKFKRGHSNGFGNRGTKNSRQKRGCYNCEEKGHFISECLNPKENRAFWSDSEEDNEPQKDATYLMEIDSQEVLSKLSSSNNDFDIIDLKKDNEELLTFSKDFSKTYEKLLQEKRALEKEHSKLFSKVNELELEVINLAKFKE
ncbi:retrotransposon protein [Tanacetum coccineum]